MPQGKKLGIEMSAFLPIADRKGGQGTPGISIYQRHKDPGNDSAH